MRRGPSPRSTPNLPSRRARLYGPRPRPDGLARRRAPLSAPRPPPAGSPRRRAPAGEPAQRPPRPPPAPLRPPPAREALVVGPPPRGEGAQRLALDRDVHAVADPDAVRAAELQRE